MRSGVKNGVMEVRSMIKVSRVNRIIKREELRANPKTLYLFGDNLIRKGLGGQAKEMRGEPNAVGIISKKYPSNRDDSFFRDRDYLRFRELLIVDAQIVLDKLNSGLYNEVIIPPIGIGLADLPRKAPKCWNLLNKFLNSLLEKNNGSDIK